MITPMRVDMMVLKVVAMNRIMTGRWVGWTAKAGEWR